MSERDLFTAALHLHETARRAFLDQACGDDRELRDKVESMLLEHDRLGSFLEPGGAVPGDATVTHATAPADPGEATVTHAAAPHPDPDETTDQPSDKVGTVIAGKFKLLEIIGEGGMGSVFMAQQIQPVKRYVAVKLVKPGMDSKQVLARFEAERQALAVMDHPNISRVYDAGISEEGRSYFVMELVKGLPITRFCDERKLTMRERLELFVPVCQAIQHAHQKGIIHRDIKPNNVLVALYDDRPVPKVIDFGIAKAAGQQLTDMTLHTGFGAVVGTPEYMSPEQASFNQLDVDTRSDIYSLGVLLYELLTGSPPVNRQQLEKAGLMEILRVVREVEPPKPSTRISTASALASISANRRTEPRKLSALVRGEIDWIVMKSLEKDRNRRYDSANAFAADVLRHLSGEAVLAAPPSASYRLKKFLRKNRGPVVAAGLVSAALVAGIAGTTWGLIRAEEEAGRVRREQAKTKDALDLSERNRDAAELNLVHSYLRPIGYNTEKVDQAEWIAFNELAGLEDDRLKLLFLREALADGERALRIARRAERVVQAAVGTSLNRRAAALELMSAKQREKDADPRIRLAACWLAIELGSDDIASFDEHFNTLLSQKDFSDWPNFLDHLPERIHPTQRARLFASLTSFVDKAKHFKGDILLDVTENSLVALALRLDSVAAKQGFDGLLSVIGMTTDDSALQTAGDGLVALALRLDSVSAKQGFDALLSAIRKATYVVTLRVVVNGLAALAPRLDAVAAKQGFDALLSIIGIDTDYSVLQAAGNGLAAFAQRLDAVAAKQGFDALLSIIGKLTNGNSLDVVGRGLAALALGRGLAALAPRLDAVAAKQGFDVWLRVIGKTTNGFFLRAAGNGLAALAPQLDAVAVKQGFDALLSVIGKTMNDRVLQAVGNGLAALAPQLDAVAVKQGFDAWLGVIGKTKDLLILYAAEGGLASFAPFVDAATAKQGFDALLSVIGKSKDHYVLGDNVEAAAVEAAEVMESAGKGLVALAPRLDAVAAKQGFDALLRVIGKTSDARALEAAGKGLAALAPRLDAVAVKQGFDTLLILIGDTFDQNELLAAANGLLALVPRLDAVAAKQGFDALLRVIGIGWTNAVTEQAVANGLAALAPRLDAAVVKQSFDASVKIFGKEDRYTREARSALVALASHFDSVMAKQGFDVWLRSDEYRIQHQERIIPALIPRLNAALRSSHSAMALIHLLAAGRSDPNYRLDDDVVYQLLGMIDNVEDLTDFLRDPVCLGTLKDAVLLRLEELAYPNPEQAAVFVGMAANRNSPLTSTAVKLAADEERKFNRRFRTVSDAAKWLAEHHPEIDLDRPYNKKAVAK